MREESARVIQGMREQRDADIKQREDLLAQEKENQQLEAAQRDRDYQIESKNLDNTLTGIQAETRAQQQQYEQNIRDNAEILKGISNISASAGKAYGEYVVAQEDKTIAEALDRYLQDGINEDMRAMLGEKGLDIADEYKNHKLDELAAKGYDPVAIAKTRNYSPRVAREIQKGKAEYFYQYKYATLLHESVRKREEQLGKRLSSSELAAHVTDVGRVVAERFRKDGGMHLKPGSMRTAIQTREGIHQKFIADRRKEELTHEKQISIENATTILTQNPKEFTNNIQASFMSWYRGNDYDYTAAHDQYEALYTMRGPDGNFLFSEEQLASAILGSSTQAHALERPGRHAAGLRARMEDDNKFRYQQIRTVELAYEEASVNAQEEFVKNPTKRTAEMLLSHFSDIYGKQPSWLVTAGQNFTVEAKSKALQIEQLESIPDGFIIEEQVEALKRLDVTAGKGLEERFLAQEAKYNTGTYKELSDAFKTTANGVTSFGSQKPNTAASLALQRGMRAEFRRRVDRRVGSGADKEAFDTAAEIVALEIEKEVKEAAKSKDPKALFYRKLSGPGGAAEFPNLYSQANLNAYEKSRRSYQAIVDSIIDNGGGAIGLEKTLDTPESILTKDEITAIVSGYGKPGFVVPTDVLAVTGMANGLDPFTVINRQIEALGDPNLLPLEPPPIINSINTTMTEQQRQDLFNAVNGPRQRMRALHSSVGTPLNYRAGIPVASAVGAVPYPTPREVYDYLRELGVSDIHAKGILANIQGESGFKTDEDSGDNGMSAGLFQMYNDRKRKMELSVPDWRTNWKGQVKHALRDDTAPQYLQMQFNSPEEAADWFLDNYERPAMEHRAGRKQLNRSFIPNLGF